MNELDGSGAGALAAVRAALERQEAALLALLRRLDYLRCTSAPARSPRQWCGSAQTAYTGAADRLRRELDLAGELLRTARSHTLAALDDLSQLTG